MTCRKKSHLKICHATSQKHGIKSKMLCLSCWCAWNIYNKVLTYLHIYSYFYVILCLIIQYLCVAGNKDFTCKVGLDQLNQANLHPARHEFKRRPTQSNLSPIGVRNQRKFVPNPSPIRIRIPACISVSIFSITFGSDVQSRWFKLGWKVNLKGYNFVVYQKSEFWS